MDLHSRDFVTRLDPHGMLRLTEEFPIQCERALEIARRAEPPKLANPPAVVVVTGLGGSAAGGDFARSLYEANGAAPLIVNRDYHMPNYLGLGDLVFCCSYSGNTEETLSAYVEAKKAGAKVIVISSGGKLTELAKADGHTVVTVPGGQPPRTALGFMLIPVLVLSEKLKLIPAQPYEKAIALLKACRAKWTVEGAENGPKELATALHGKLGIIYGLGLWQGLLANRWKGQINENAKVLAFQNSFPELNHNEILGWVGAKNQGANGYVVVTLQDGTESKQMKARLQVSKTLIGETAEFFDVFAEGDSLLEKLLSLTYYGDFTSIYLAALEGVDPEDIGSINTLKSELAKLS